MPAFNRSKLDELRHVYGSCLTIKVMAHPDKYCYGLDKVNSVADRIVSGVPSGNFIHDSDAMVATCAALGIPNTRKAIKSFIQGSL